MRVVISDTKIDTAANISQYLRVLLCPAFGKRIQLVKRDKHQRIAEAGSLGFCGGDALLKRRPLADKTAVGTVGCGCGEYMQRAVYGKDIAVRREYTRKLRCEYPRIPAYCGRLEFRVKAAVEINCL